VITRERYGVDSMKQARQRAIESAKGATTWGLVLGTLGRQGNPAILGHLKRMLKAQGKPCVLVLLSEVGLVWKRNERRQSHKLAAPMLVDFHTSLIFCCVALTVVTKLRLDRSHFPFSFFPLFFSFLLPPFTTTPFSVRSFPPNSRSFTASMRGCKWPALA